MMYFCRSMRPNNNTLSVSLAEKFSGLIWKVKIHVSGLIAIESRNSDSKEVSFSVFNFLSGETYFKEKVYDESWNLSLAYLTGSNLILNGYEHADSPESKGIISVDVNTGSVIWQKFNVSLNSIQENGLEVFDPRLQPRKYQWIDHLKAEPIPVPFDLKENIGILFPQASHSGILPPFISQNEIIGDISGLVYADYVFVSFHEKKNSNMQQRMVVYQGDRILLDDILISDIQKLQPEAFFIQQNHLFYIRNKQEIISYLV